LEELEEALIAGKESASNPRLRDFAKRHGQVHPTVPAAQDDDDSVGFDLQILHQAAAAGTRPFLHR